MTFFSIKYKSRQFIARVLIWLLRDSESNLCSHARRELRACGLFGEDDFYGGMTGEAVMDLVTVFASHGHSGMSADLVRSLFGKVADYQPLSPLTGEDSEWNEVSDGVLQNNRCSHVFRELDGEAYDSEGRIFKDKDGSCFTSFDSRVNVEFPYTPKKEYVNVEENE